MDSLSRRHAHASDEAPLVAITDVHEAADLRQIWGLIADHKRLVLGVAGAVAAGLVLLTLLSPMRFRTTGRLYLGELNGRVTAERSDELDLSGEVRGDVGSEVEILRSRSLAQRAILAAGTNVSIARADEGRLRMWKWLLSGRDPSLVDGVYEELRAVSTRLSEDARESRSFRVRILEGQNYLLWSTDPDATVTDQVRGAFGAELEYGPLRLTLVPGEGRAPRVGTEYDLEVRPLDEVLDEVIDNLSVSVPKTSAGTEPVKVIHAEFTAGSPAVAASYLKALMRAYLEERQAWKTENATAAESFVTNQLKAMREALDETERKHAEYRSNTRVVVLDSEAKAMIEQIAKYEEQRVAARLEVASLTEMRRMLANPKASVEAFFVGESSDTVLQNLAESLTKAQQTLTDLEAKFSPEAPDVRAQRNQVQAQLQTIRNYVANRLARAQENLSSINAIITQFEDRLKTVPGAELRLAQLAREAEVYRRMYSYLLERQQQAALVKASKVSRNRILDEPQRTYIEDSPKLLLRFASCLLGLLLGVVVVLVRHAMVPTFHSAAEVERTLKLPVFTDVPHRHSPLGLTLADAPLFRAAQDAAPDSDTPFAKAFQRLRGNVYCAASGSYGQVVLLSSPSQDDGKTTCALSLAAALASDEHSVLLVDANLRTPSVHELLDQTREPGLSTLLRGACGLEEVVRSVTLAGEKVHVITAGRAACSDLLATKTFSEFLEKARARYNYVILDTASAPVADVVALARQCDLTLTVVRLEQTWRRRALAHVQLMEANTPNHAIVVNGPPSRRERESLRGRVLPLFSPGQRRPQRLKAPSLDTAPDQPAESA